MDNRKHKQPEDFPEWQTKGKRMQRSARPERWQQQLFGWQDHRGSQEGGSADKDVAPSRGFDDTHQAQANDSQQDQPRAKKRRMSQEEREMQSSVPIIADGNEFELRWDKTAKDNLKMMKKELPDLMKNLNEHAIREMRSFSRQKSGAWSINHEKLSNDQKSMLNYNLQSNKQKVKKRYEERKDKVRQYRKEYREEHKDKVQQIEKKYREEHKDKIRQKKKKYREEHKDKFRQYYKEYCKEHKDKFRQISKKYRGEHKLLINSRYKYKRRIVSMYHKYVKTQEIRHFIEIHDIIQNKDVSASSRSQQSQAQVQEYRKRLAKMQKQMQQMYHELWDLDHTLHVLYQEKAQRKANPADQREESALQGGQPSQERGEGSHTPVQQAEHWTGMSSAESMPSQETVGLQARRPPLPDNWQDFLKSVQTSPIGAKLLKIVEKQLVALSTAEHAKSGAEPMATEGLQLPPEQSFPTNQDQEIRDEWTDSHANTAGSDQHAGNIWDDPHIWKLLQTWENNHTNSNAQDEMNELYNDPKMHEMLHVFLDENDSDSSSKARPHTETGLSQPASTNEIFMLSVPLAASRLGPLEDCSSESKLASDIEEVDTWLNLEP